MKYLIRAVAGMLALTVVMEAGAQCTADVTGNGIVDGADLGTVLAYWGPRSQDPTSIASDLNGDGTIDGADLGILLANWGPCQSTVSSISPNQGCVVGGTQVTITGTYLGSTSAVRFGDNPATRFTVVDQNTLQATTPSGAGGPAEVQVTTAGGVTTASQAFTYMPASVSSIIPHQGPSSGGTPITITGECLGSTTGVMIGGNAAVSLAIVNSNTITCFTPPGTIGSVDVSIVGTTGSVQVPAGFQYQPAPQVIAWGFNGSGQCNVPTNLGFVAECSAGAGHVLCLSDQGQVTAWGSNLARYGELTNQSVVPAGLPHISKVSAGGYHSVLLTAQGGVVAWGYNSQGQCSVPQSGPAIDVAAGYYHTSILLSNGSVRSFGYTYSIPGWQSIQGVTKLFAAGYQTLGIRADGSLVAWGANWHGEGSIPSGLPTTSKACGGVQHAAALSVDGVVRCWGSNSYGQCDVPADLGTVVDLSIAIGGNCTMALTSSGQVVGWGLQTDAEHSVPPGSERSRRVIAGGGVPPSSNGYRQFTICIQDGP
jgi:hypothetical protein